MRSDSGRGARSRSAGLTVGWLALSLAAFAGCTPEPREPPEVSSDFLGAETCGGCHPNELRAWQDSHHQLAMQPADDDSVLGNFDDANASYAGVESRFFRRDGGFFVRTDGPDGDLRDYEVLYTFGVDPLQQYLVAFPGGRFQSLPWAFDTVEQRWFHLYPDEALTHEDPLHWTGRLQNWNYMCAECHSTNLRRNYDSQSDTYETTWSEINVSCEACHGPGAAHVAWADGGAAAELGADGSRSSTALLAPLRGTSALDEIEACAPCHSRRATFSDGYRHGEALLDHYLPSLLLDGLYHADGQIDDEVYVYGSFLQSRMFREGVRCSDCHDPHSLDLRAEGNALCAQCHKPEQFDTPLHHFHPPPSAGARCVECHMPEKTYMVVDPRRDHSMRVPRPALAREVGAPTACDSCHADEDPGWAAEAVERWYGREHDRAAAPHYALALAAARAGTSNAGEALSELALDETAPAIARATALEALTRYPSEQGARAIEQGLLDEDPLVRHAAVGSAPVLGPERRRDAVSPLLTDPARVIRAEAARALASESASFAGSETARHWRAARAEYEAAQGSNADQPWAHLNLGVLYNELGEFDRAEAAYRRALKIDPGFVPGRTNLAHLYNRRGRNAEAEVELREVIRLAPDFAEAYYSLGLLLAEENRLREAVGHLGRASRLMPERARVHYNYSLALQHLGRLDAAEQALLTAWDLEPENGEYLLRLAHFYLQQQEWQRAETFARRLVAAFPDDQEPKDLLSQIQSHKN